jgi:uracil-xanthine permease
MSSTVHPVDEMLPLPRLATLGMQHVLVMYAGAIAVPLIIGRALNLDPQQVAYLISADLFVCGIVTIIQSFGATQWFGIKLPVMMGVTFAAVGPMVAVAASNPGLDGARLLFGAIIGAGVIGIFIAPLVGRMLRFFPPVVTGTIILVIGVSLMRVGINWVFGLPFGPTAPKIVNPEHAAWLQSVTDAAAAAGSTVPPVPAGMRIAPSIDNVAYAPLSHIGIAAVVLISILLIAKYGKGFVQNIAVLLGIIIGAVLTAALGMMSFEAVGKVGWFALITPFTFGMPIFDPVLIITMVLVMIVSLIESTGMFLALSDLVDKKMTTRALTNGLRTDGLGTVIGGIFNTFPYTSFSQNVGLVGVTGVKSRFVCVAAGVILIIFGLIPKMGALVESLPTYVLGGAGIVMFGMVAATGIRILSHVDFKNRRNNLFVVAVSLALGMVPLIAPDYKMWMPHAIHSLIESGILLATMSAVILNFFFNGANVDEDEVKEAAMAAEAH